MSHSTTAFFRGLSTEQLESIVGQLTHRHYSRGTIVVAEGDVPHEIYVIQSGTADVYIADRHGGVQRIGAVGPGATVGEMSIFTGQPASATVRATEALEVLVLSEAQFMSIAAQFPRIYQNLAAIMAERLARSNRHALRATCGRAIVLLNQGAPPLLGYTLACSLAWHTRSSTLLVKITTDAASDDMVALAAKGPEAYIDHGAALTIRGSPPRAARRAHLMLTTPTGPFSPVVLAGTLDDLCTMYDYVLVQLPDAASTLPSPSVRLLDMHETATGRAEAGWAIRGWALGARGTSPGPDGVLSVPPLEPADHDALARGLLSLDTLAGKAIAWAARHLADLKVGLALGGGSIRGYAHIGVLNVLERVGLSVNYLAGTSAGSVVATLHALGYAPDVARDLMDKVGEGLVRPRVSTRSLLSNTGLRAKLRAVGGNRRFEDLPVPLAIVAADIVSGREVVFRRGLLWQAVLASITLPGIWPPICMGDYKLVDGGVLNPAPSNVAAEMGADVVIAVRLATPAITPAPDAEARETQGVPPSLVHTMLRAFDMMTGKISGAAGNATTILIEPIPDKVSGLGLWDFKQGHQYITLGEQAAEAALPRILAALPWLRPPE